MRPGHPLHHRSGFPFESLPSRSPCPCQSACATTAINSTWKGNARLRREREVCAEPLPRAELEHGDRCERGDRRRAERVVLVVGGAREQQLFPEIARPRAPCEWRVGTRRRVAIVPEQRAQHWVP
eukprot:3759173-Pleurochrysis_carterae.AAC.1